MQTALALASELTIALCRMIEGALTVLIVIGITGLIVLDLERRRH